MAKTKREADARGTHLIAQNLLWVGICLYSTCLPIRGDFFFLFFFFIACQNRLATSVSSEGTMNSARNRREKGGWIAYVGYCEQCHVFLCDNYLSIYRNDCEPGGSYVRNT